jgi:ankyrin repeat protein/L-ascorbate metabolism protein UlaG (beta-lactamase superfamily)
VIPDIHPLFHPLYPFLRLFIPRTAILWSENRKLLKEVKMFGKKLLVITTALFSLALICPAQDIFEAAKKGETASVKRLLREKPERLQARNPAGMTPLHVAARAGHQELAELFIEAGADINARDKAGATPLIHSLMAGKKDMAVFLVDKGADVTIKTNDGMPAIAGAFILRSPGLVESMIDKGQDVNEDLVDGATLLHGAAIMGANDMIPILLSKGARLDAVDNNGRTPLDLTIIRGNLETAAALLSGGSDPNKKNPMDGFTPLHLAALKGFKTTVELLVSKNAEINAIDGKGLTPLQYASLYGHRSAADFLISKGAIPKKCRDNFGPSPLLTHSLKSGEAYIWYLGHSGWAVKTKNNLLVFDYSEDKARPDDPLLANGHIHPDEIKGQQIFVFSSHGHPDHFSPLIFAWTKTLSNVTYIMGHKPKEAPDCVYFDPREEKSIQGLKVTSLESTDEGVGFLVELDGLVIYHAGDHGNRQRDLKGPFVREVDFLAGKGLKVDLAFLPITGCGFRDDETVYAGNIYTMDKLKTKIVFPMHAGGSETLYARFAETVKDKVKARIICAENRGDHFTYKRGKIKK